MQTKDIVISLLSDPLVSCVTVSVTWKVKLWNFMIQYRRGKRKPLLCLMMRCSQELIDSGDAVEIIKNRMVSNAQKYLKK